MWLYAEDDANGPLVQGNSTMGVRALPSLEWMLDSMGTKRYPYDKTFEQAAWDEIIIIHTSGTTGKLSKNEPHVYANHRVGVPKPIRHTNGFYSVLNNVNTLSRKHWPRGIAYESWIGKTVLNVCPPQWIAGLHAMIMCPAFLNSPCVMLPRESSILTADVFHKILAMAQIDGLKCPPYTIVTLFADLEARAQLKALEFIVYMGAALERSIGDDLYQHTRLTCVIGSTETGDQQSLRPADRSLWYTHDFVPENGHSMIPYDADGLHELVIDTLVDGMPNQFQLAAWNPAFRDSRRIETNELYLPVKDTDGRTRWTFATRKDDLTKLDWLAKFHAQDIESRIQQHPHVAGVVVGGEGRPTPYVIIEVKKGVLGVEPSEQLLDELYSSVIVRANSADIDEIRIPKETVMIANKEKPFKRSFKQVIQRKEVEKEYLKEIEQAYSQLGKVRLA